MLLGVDSLSSKSSAYFEFFVQEMMIITDSSLAVSFDFRQLGRRLVFRNLYVTLDIDMIMPQWRLGYDNWRLDSPTEGAHSRL